MVARVNCPIDVPEQRAILSLEYEVFPAKTGLYRYTCARLRTGTQSLEETAHGVFRQTVNRHASNPRTQF
jgi:hypothetical protein